MASRRNRLTLLDCTVRDGGHLTGWNLEDKFVNDYWDAVKDSGVDIVEIGYRTTPGLMTDQGRWRFTPNELIGKVLASTGRKKDSVKIAVMGDATKIHEDDFIEAHRSPIDIVRIAFYQQDIEEAIRVTNAIAAKGYKTGMNIMASHTYSPDEFEEALEKLDGSSAGVIYIADSFGSFKPEQVKGLISTMKKKLTNHREVGYHAHENQGLAFDNAKAAVDAGATWVDATVGGMGRGAGNLRTEEWMRFINEQHRGKYELDKIESFIEEEQAPIRDDFKARNLDWGCTELSRLTGEMGVHPNYGTNLVKEGYSVDEVRRILKNLETDKKNPGFDKASLESALDKSGLRKTVEA